MSAGGSAEEQARRHRERARRAERQAEAWEKGAEGERRVAEKLRDLPPEFVVFHDLRLPAPSKANVDHVVVGPNGIVAIDTKNYSHPVSRGTGKGSDTLWTGRYPMRKELAACSWEAAAVSDLVGYAVEPMMCLIAPSVPSQAFDFDEIRICTPTSLVEEVRARAIEPVDVAAAVAAIEQAFGAVSETRHPAPPSKPKRVVPAASSRTNAPSWRPVARALLSALDSQLFRVAAAGLGLLVLISSLPAATSWLSSTMSDAALDAAESARERAQARTTDAQESAASTVAATLVADSTSPPTTFPEIGAPPAVDVVLTCPSPGSKWQLSWVWPGDLPEGAVGYMVRTRRGEGPIYTHSWAGWFSPDDPPRPIDTSAGTSFTIITDYIDGRSQVVGRTEELFVAPVAEC